MDDVLPDRLKKNLVSIISDMQMVSHLFGKDGSALAIAHNPNDKKAHRRHNSLECNEKGYNQLHSYALYDLQNRIYVDMIIKPGRFPNEAKALLDMMEHSNIQERVLQTVDMKDTALWHMLRKKDGDFSSVRKIWGVRESLPIWMKMRFPWKKSKKCMGGGAESSVLFGN